MMGGVEEGVGKYTETRSLTSIDEQHGTMRYDFVGEAPVPMYRTRD
jgi:hypothetical protein